MARERKAEDPAQVRARQAARMKRLRDGGFDDPGRIALYQAGQAALIEWIKASSAEAVKMRETVARMAALAAEGKPVPKARYGEMRPKANAICEMVEVAPENRTGC